MFVKGNTNAKIERLETDKDFWGSGVVKGD